MLCQTDNKTNDVTLARPDGVVDHPLPLPVGETRIAAVEVTATPQDHLMTVALGHAVVISNVDVYLHGMKTEDVMVETGGSITAKTTPSDRHQERLKELSRKAHSGMDNKDRTATIRAVLTTIGSPPMPLQTLRPIYRKRHSHLSMRRRSLRNRRCQISSLAHSLCSPFRRRLRQCSFKDLAAFLAAFLVACHHLHLPASADHFLRRHQTWPRCQTILTTSIVSGATFSRERIQDSISNRTLDLTNSKARAAFKTKGTIKTILVFKVGEVGMEQTVKVVGTTTEGATGDVDVGEDTEGNETELSPQRQPFKQLQRRPG